MAELLWRERKRLWCRLPWTFTVYSLTPDALTVRSGLLFERVDTVKLFRITDLTVERSLLQRLFGLGSIVVDGFDQSTGGRVVLRNVTRVFAARDLIDRAVDAARGANGVRAREYGGMDMGDAADGWL
ncbi:PH domain-containing protein [Bifidobacterium myosotis]|uniref:PH domain-containing protein n=1 Tax=Bifidobacterium myosotis TaxID=1630166 RepID=A0A5M9ZMT5_9BIFI|nr:PH domain-containing protein [Bifidobacterium myosotis]KAA8828162.1 PH domain-containing protein [Bifidobacterium myosotis]